jgi:glycosyltransferase involved in cell wall biosynthesis
MRAELESLGASLAIADLVRFAGARPPRPSWFALADVAVLSSLSEGSPNAIVEAMAAGCAIAATDVGGVSEALEPEVSGLLVPVGDTEAMAVALARLLTQPALRARLGRNAQARAQHLFNQDVVVESVMRWYEELVSWQRCSSPLRAEAGQ